MATGDTRRDRATIGRRRGRIMRRALRKLLAAVQAKAADGTDAEGRT